MVIFQTDYGDETNGNLEHARMELEKSITELGNKRTRGGTLDDALDAYNGFVEKSRQILAESWADQAERLKKDGWHGTGNCSFNLWRRFSRLPNTPLTRIPLW